MLTCAGDNEKKCGCKKKHKTTWAKAKVHCEKQDGMTLCPSLQQARRAC